MAAPSPREGAAIFMHCVEALGMPATAGAAQHLRSGSPVISIILLKLFTVDRRCVRSAAGLALTLSWPQPPMTSQSPVGTAGHADDDPAGGATAREMSVWGSRHGANKATSENWALRQVLWFHVKHGSCCTRRDPAQPACGDPAGYAVSVRQATSFRICYRVLMRLTAEDWRSVSGPGNSSLCGEEVSPGCFT